MSKLGDLESYSSDPRRIEYAGANTDGGNVDYKGKYTTAQQTIKDRYAKFEVPYHGVDKECIGDRYGHRSKWSRSYCNHRLDKNSLQLMEKFKHGKQADSLAKIVVRMLIPYKKIVKTITSDNGKYLLFIISELQQM